MTTMLNIARVAVTLAWVGTILAGAACAACVAGNQLCDYGFSYSASFVVSTGVAACFGAVVYGAGPILSLSQAVRNAKAGHPVDRGNCLGWAVWSLILALIATAAAYLFWGLCHYFYNADGYPDYTPNGAHAQAVLLAGVLLALGALVTSVVLYWAVAQIPRSAR